MLTIQELKKYEWTEAQKCKDSNSTFQIGKLHQKSVLFMKNIEQVQIDQNQLNQTIQKLIKLSSTVENMIQVKNVFKKSLSKNETKKSFKGQLKLIQQFFYSTPLSQWIKKKQAVNKQQFIRFIIQLVSVMSQAQNIELYHKNLHPDNILIFRKDQKEDLCLDTVKLKQWNIFQYQEKQPKQYLKQLKNSKMWDYLHPQIIFNQQIKWKSKYDIYSLGIVLYQLLNFDHPFKNTEKLRQLFESKQDPQFESSRIQLKIISKMLSFSQQKSFKSWSQVKTYLIISLQLNLYDFKPIKLIYEVHRRVLSYMIQMYNFINWNLKYSSNNFWFQFKKEILVFSKALVQFICLINLKFLVRYQFKFNMLSTIQRQQISKFQTIIKNQWKHIKKVIEQVYGDLKDSQHMRSSWQIDTFDMLIKKDFFIHFQDFGLVLIKIKLIIDQSKKIKSNILKSSKVKTWSNIQFLQKFCSQFIKIYNQIDKNNKRILPAMYGSNLFQK